MDRNKKRYNSFFKFCSYAFATLFSLAGYVTTEFAVNGLDGATKTPMILLAIASFGIMVSCMVFIIIGAGEKKKDENIHLAHADYLFTEFWLFMTGAGLGSLYSIYFYFVSKITPRFIAWRIVLTYLLVMCAAILILICMAGIVRRIKGGVMYKNSFVCVVATELCKSSLYRGIGGIWRTALAAVIYFAITVGMIFVAKSSFVIAITVEIVVTVIFILIFCSVAKELEMLSRGSGEIANGNLQHKIKTTTNIFVINEIANNINRLNDGMQTAIDKQIKSERMKSELITNVSHDIKTPLTSIINYIDLLKNDASDKESFVKYINILDQKASRLKTLIEDLVEASKASTGNVSVELNRINARELISQSIGEFKERFEERGLDVIIDLPKEPITVVADGRHLFRVIENMLSNACKYAMEKSRVYIDLYIKDELVYIEVKNISGKRLNITEDELMQRFVRGDASRNTEGTGLGLSIAKSLAQVQGGEFNIVIDGDLFKAIVSFPLAEEIERVEIPEEPPLAPPEKALVTDEVEQESV